MDQQLSLFSVKEVGASAAVGIEGARYRADLLSAEEEAAVLLEVDRRPWSEELRRRVQHYGYRYDYKSRRVTPSMYLGPLPEFVLRIARLIRECALMDKQADQVIVNEYLPGQGISAHVDCEPCFGETIAMVSLGWAYEMDFIHRFTHEEKTLLLDRGSVLSISGEARHAWLHQIKSRKSDHGIPRKRRVSLTFRTMTIS